MLYMILKKLGIQATPENTHLSPFVNAEDGEPYQVWRVGYHDRVYVLKKAKGYEMAVYQAFFTETLAGAPRFYGSVHYDGSEFFLMSYVDGRDLCHCTRTALTKALDALIALQKQFWNNQDLADAAYSFEASLESRIKRGRYLDDPIIENAYTRFLETYNRIPRTLCHDDLLPFNVLVGEDRATLIDWEYGGILPYLSPLARLIAHTAEDGDAFFYMTEADKQFAVDYYYDRLVKEKGISYETYRRDLDDFLLYEYCEWIMLGNKYENTESERYREYRRKALVHIEHFGKKIYDRE